MAVEVVIDTEHGHETDIYYYKLFDDGACDVELDPGFAVALPPPSAWRTMWTRFLWVSVELQLNHLHLRKADVMLHELVDREVGDWDDEICVDFSVTLALPALQLESPLHQGALRPARARS